MSGIVKGQARMVIKGEGHVTPDLKYYSSIMMQDALIS